jgi:hypothetical protein
MRYQSSGAPYGGWRTADPYPGVVRYRRGVTLPLRRRRFRLGSGLVGVGGLAVSAVGLVGLAWSTPALADDSGGVSNLDPTSTGEILLRLVLVPLAFVIVIALLAAAPRLLRRPRYRPGTPWPYDPLWFAGPARPEAAIARARPARGTGGASAEW